MDLNKLRGFYDALDNALDVIPHEQFVKIVFTRREQMHTCALVLHHRCEEDRENFEKLINYNVWDDFYKTPHGTVSHLGVDLESIGTEFLRIYHNQPHNKPYKNEKEYLDFENWPDFLENYGYYVNTKSNSLDILGTKEYIKSVKDLCYKIKYYDKNKNLIGEDCEVIAVYEDWNGPKEIYDIVVKEGVQYSFAKKADKDNGYFMINPTPSKRASPFKATKWKNKLLASARKAFESRIEK